MQTPDHERNPIGDPFVLGLNYWPRNKAMYWWADFDAGEVREEFAMIRGLGLTHVRFFLLWESFQPMPDVVSTTALSNLRTVCDIAAETGLLLQPTFFTGHMSGPNWAPDWLIDPTTPLKRGERQIVSLTRSRGSPNTIHNVYTTPFVIEAEDLQIRAVCGELKDHPAIWGYSLGNEPDLFCKPPDADTGRRWVRDRVRTIKAADPNHLVLIGLHGASLDGDVGLRVDHIARETDLSVMHGYSIYHPLARRPLDPDFVPFTCALTRALAGRPVLYEEFGVNTNWPDQPSHWADAIGWDALPRRIFFASEDDAAEYFAGVLPRLHRVGAIGAFCWCFPDYHSRLWDRPPCDFQPHERFFGLWRPDGSLKPMGRAIAEFAKQKPTVQAPAKTVTLPVSADEFYKDPGCHTPALYARFGTINL
jgi:endo-1,4-beta-mannosidase